MRDRDIGPKAPGERRVVVLGDSLVMSVQVPVEDTFVARLERRLNASAVPPATFRVINAGVQGYGPVEEYLFHREVTAALRPDIVVLALYPGNDAVEAGATAYKLRGPGPSRSADADLSAWQRFTQWRRRMIRKSIVLQVARLRVTTVLDRFGWRPEIDAPLRTYLPDAPPEIDKGLEVTKDVVSRLDALTRQEGSRLVVVLLPARFQVDDGDYGRLKAIVARPGRRSIGIGATERFKAALTGLNVPVFDALPPLREAARQAEVYMQSTAHFTAAGHEALAGILEQYLRAGCARRRAGRLMLFTSLQFAVFFAAVFAAYRLLPHRGQNWLLLAASYYFYASWDWRFLGLLVVSTGVAYGSARLLGRLEGTASGHSCSPQAWVRIFSCWGSSSTSTSSRRTCRRSRPRRDGDWTRSP